MPSGKQKKKQTKGAGQGPARSRGAVKAAPIATTSVVHVKEPIVRSTPRGVTVRHREYVADVQFPSGSPAFVLNSFGINPGMPTCFPWLSTMGNSYELYRFKRLEFEYVPRCAATTNGSIYLAVDWDANDVVPDSKAAMLAYQGAVSDAAWSGMLMRCPGPNLSLFAKERYTRAGEYLDIDIKTYDVGKLLVACLATETLAADCQVGELWVDYEVELMVPQIRQANRAGTIAATYSAMDPYAASASDGIFSEAKAVGGITQTGAVPGSLSYNGKDFRFSRPWEGIIRSTCVKTASAVRRLSNHTSFGTGVLTMGVQKQTTVLQAPSSTSVTDVIENYVKVAADAVVQVFVEDATNLLSAGIVFLAGQYAQGVFPEAPASVGSCFDDDGKCDQAAAAVCRQPPRRR